MFGNPQLTSNRLASALLILFYVAVCCVPSNYVALFFSGHRVTHDPHTYFARYGF
jgi:hypothetical protein